MTPELACRAWTAGKLSASDVEAVARLLAAAFVDNPTYMHMHPREESRAHDLERFFIRNLTWRARLELTWTIRDREGRVVGTTTLEPPGGVPHSSAQLFRHWVWPTFVEQGARSVVRLADTNAAFVRNYLAISKGRPYWHVHAVAVDPERQGLGAGRALLSQVLSELDARARVEPAPVLLSTQRERNVALYQGFGFELVSSTMFHGYRSWFMQRR